jgi:hypothetical protein
VDVQLKVDASPCSTEVGLAERVTEG